MLPILLPLLLFLTAPSPSQSDFRSPSKLIFILAGQSNMAGRGGVVNTTWDHIIPPESSPNQSILRLNAHLQWEPAHEPLHADIDVLKTCGVGPGMAFANAVRSGGCEGEIGLVPCAIGGTTISEWERGQGLYERMVRRARAAVEEGGGRVGAVLWYQGESDTEEMAEAEAYAGRMARLVRDLREDLGQPGLLVIQVRGCIFNRLILLSIFDDGLLKTRGSRDLDEVVRGPRSCWGFWWVDTWDGQPSQNYFGK